MKTGSKQPRLHDPSHLVRTLYPPKRSRLLRDDPVATSRAVRALLVVMRAVHQLLGRHDDAGGQVAQGLRSFHQPLPLGAQLQLRLLPHLGRNKK